MTRAMYVVTCAVVAAATAVSTPAAQPPAPPVIRTMTLNGGAATVATDRVTLVFTYDHPAAPSTPIPFYRIRMKGPDNEFSGWDPYLENTRGTNRLAITLYRRNGIDPIPGPHMVELQIQDALNQESNVMSATIRRVIPPPPTAEYSLTGSQVGQAIALAETRGYGWFVSPANGNSGCVRKDGAPGTWLRVASKTPGPSALTSSDPRAGCLWRFMQHKPLKTGWRIARVDVGVGSAFSRCQAPDCQVEFGAQAGQGEGFSVRHRVSLYPSSQAHSTPAIYSDAAEATITGLTLQGPAGSAWQDAFQP
ncbi:MAG: hypothetical protein R2708_05270 [Vicinamibacterales bacterium]